MNYRIAIVEDDADQLQNYSDSLRRKGFDTVCFESVETALPGIAESNPDMVLLDVVLGDDPDGGFTICRKLLDQGSELPIIFLSDRSEEIDQVFGLRLGAWDYQTKPISLAFLAERIKSLQRIHQARSSAQVPAIESSNTQNRAEDSPLQLDRDKSYASWHGKTVPLTLTEFRILTTIFDSGERGADYAALCDSTLQRMVTNGTINSHIKNLRKKFNQLGPEFKSIRNKPGFGYYWEHPVGD